MQAAAVYIASVIAFWFGDSGVGGGAAYNTLRIGHRKYWLGP